MTEIEELLKAGTGDGMYFEIEGSTLKFALEVRARNSSTRRSNSGQRKTTSCQRNTNIPISNPIVTTTQTQNVKTYSFQ
jgi:hypothetical protein